MNYYQLQLGPNANQATILQALQQLGGETIQTSNGLFSATPASDSEVREATQKADPEAAVQVEAVDASGDRSALSKDAQNLIERLN